MADKTEQARREGMLYALNVAKEKGIDGLADEVAFRNITKLPTAVSRSECDKQVRNIATIIYRDFMIASTATLIDQFDFNNDQLREYCERMDLKEQCIDDGIVSFDDYAQVLAEEHNVIIKLKDLK